MTNSQLLIYMREYHESLGHFIAWIENTGYDLSQVWANCPNGWWMAQLGRFGYPRQYGDVKIRKDLRCLATADTIRDTIFKEVKRDIEQYEVDIKELDIERLRLCEIVKE